MQENFNTEVKENVLSVYDNKDCFPLFNKVKNNIKEQNKTLRAMGYRT